MSLGGSFRRGDCSRPAENGAALGSDVSQALDKLICGSERLEYRLLTLCREVLAGCSQGGVESELRVPIRHSSQEPSHSALHRGGMGLLARKELPCASASTR